MHNFDPKRILTVKDLMSVSVAEVGSPLVDLRSEMPEIDCVYEKFDMASYTGEAMLVRVELISLLRQAYQLLQQARPGFSFRIQYGYRHLTVQQEYFVKRYGANKERFPEMSEESLIEQTHLQVAYPPVSGHPTGGAIDLTIIDAEGVPLDMGTKIADYSQPEKCFTYSDGVTKEQSENRLLLARVLMEAGFAPFNGEWWHFSYGDREWAKFYGKHEALFGQLSYRTEKPQ
jgi:D-alanyl-D-alanine dipeptidase